MTNNIVKSFRPKSTPKNLVEFFREAVNHDFYSSDHASRLALQVWNTFSTPEKIKFDTLLSKLCGFSFSTIKSLDESKAKQYRFA